MYRLLLYFVALGGIFVYNYWVPHRFSDLPIQYSSKIFDRNNIFIGYTLAQNFYDPRQKDKSLSINTYKEVPSILIRILASSEDKSLHDEIQNRFGIRFRGMGRAVLHLGKSGGGSGVFQQLVKNLFLRSEGGLNRKLTEMQVASAMYLQYPPEDMIILYLNNVHFGQNIRGFKAAAAFFYSKNLNDCNLAEMATLVGMLNGPNLYYDARNKRKNAMKNRRAVARRNRVLTEMVEDGIISSAEYRLWSSRPVRFKFDYDLSKHAVSRSLRLDEMVNRELHEIFTENLIPPKTSNLNIYTFFDIKAQLSAERIIRNYWLNKFKGSMKRSQVALVSIDLKTGGIVTIVGGNPSAASVGINRATSLFKPLGSVFKPFFYGSMFEKGYSVNHKLPDGDLDNGWRWKVKNSDGVSTGNHLTLKESMIWSKNVPVCYAMNKKLVLPAEIENFARRCGIERDLPNNMQIAIGGLTAGITPLELANAYATIANDGMFRTIKVIRRIETSATKNKKAETLYDYAAKEETERRVAADVASQLKYCLEEVVNRGTASGIRSYYRGYAAGKTGTSDNNKDVWFAGFTDKHSTAIWIGFDDNRESLPKEYNEGGKIAAPIWGLFMSEMRKR